MLVAALAVQEQELCSGFGSSYPPAAPVLRLLAFRPSNCLSLGLCWGSQPPLCDLTAFFTRVLEILIVPWISAWHCASGHCAITLRTIRLQCSLQCASDYSQHGDCTKSERVLSLLCTALNIKSTLGPAWTRCLEKWLLQVQLIPCLQFRP